MLSRKMKSWLVSYVVSIIMHAMLLKVKSSKICKESAKNDSEGQGISILLTGTAVFRSEVQTRRMPNLGSVDTICSSQLTTRGTGWR